MIYNLFAETYFENLVTIERRLYSQFFRENAERIPVHRSEFFRGRFTNADVYHQFEISFRKCEFRNRMGESI